MLFKLFIFINYISLANFIFLTKHFCYSILLKVMEFNTGLSMLISYQIYFHNKVGLRLIALA